MSAKTLTEMFFSGVAQYGTSRPTAYRAKRHGVWEAISHRDAEARVRLISLGLRELGIQPGDRVAIVSETRVEWALADWACLCARAVDVPIYPTLTAKQVEYILRDSGAVAAFCSTREQAEKLSEIQRVLPGLKTVIAFDEDAVGKGAVTLAAMEAKGRAVEAKHPTWKSDALSITPDALATLIYTSGTTGDPKGVMLTHGNLCSNVEACLHILPLTPEDDSLAMLPLSHVYERMVDYTLWTAGVIINYAESFDKVAENLNEIHPTIVLSVPRMYEKVYAKVLESALSGSFVKRKIFVWAKGVGKEWATHRLSGIAVPAWLKLRQAIADKLVFSKLRARTGGRVKAFISGSAPLSAEIAQFFFGASLPILEGYGLTETSPVLTLNPMDRPKLGTVGPAIPGVTLKFASDGEILAKGPNVMQGYYNQPAATKEAIDADGWFHTGDIGELDADGYLKITDRKKDLIKTAGGKYVAPQPIENAVKLNKFVANVVMLGDRRKFTIILIVPNFEQLEAWAKYRRLAYTSRTQLLTLPDVRAKMEREVMGMLSALAKFEMPKKVVLIEKDFTIESGELTPTLKVKRRIVEQHYAKVIDAAYAEADPLAAAMEH